MAAFTACASSEPIEAAGTGGGTSRGGSAGATDAGSNGSGGSSSGGSSSGGTAADAGGASSAGAMSTGGAVSSGGGKATGGVAGSGNSSGGGASTGGGSATGGTASGGSSGSGGNATGGAGSGGKGNGGTGSGGKATGGTGSGGKAAGGSAGCTDGDKDGLTDCDETNDGSDWTDPAVFNGLHVQRGNHCSSVGSCDENDTEQEVNACMQNNVDEELDQYAGWDWNNPPDNICNSEYRFAPNWTGCDLSWAARWSGCIHFDTAGPHCFQITGNTNQGCAALYFDGNTGNADVQTGTAVKCFPVAAGNYPLMFHYTMDLGSNSDMHVRYCDAQGGSTCTPTQAIPSRMLRTSCP